MRNYNILKVFWKDIFVGNLERIDEGFQFSYREDLNKALEAGFHRLLLPTFPDPKMVYKAKYMWPIFNRTMPKQRPDRQEWLDQFDIDNPDDIMEVLAKTHGKSVTDHITLWDPFDPGTFYYA